MYLYLVLAYRYLSHAWRPGDTLIDKLTLIIWFVLSCTGVDWANIRSAAAPIVPDLTGSTDTKFFPEVYLNSM